MTAIWVRRSGSFDEDRRADREFWRAASAEARIQAVEEHDSTFQFLARARAGDLPAPGGGSRAETPNVGEVEVLSDQEPPGLRSGKFSSSLTLAA